MKTMSCKQMGGPCDATFTGTAEEIMKQGGDHVNAEAAKGDAAHIAAKQTMDAAMTDPAAMQAWMDKFNADFAALPDNA